MSCVITNLIKNVIKNKVVVQNLRHYPRWSHRKPLTVYTPEEYEEIEKKSQPKKPEPTVFDKYGGLKTTWNRPQNEANPHKESLKYKIKPKKSDQPLIATHQKSKVMTTDMFETVLDNDGNFIYTKMKDNDTRIGTILTEVKSKKEKDKKDLVLLEGKRLIKDALLSGCHLKYILFSRKTEVEFLKPFLPKVGAQLYKMPYREMQMWSDLSTTPGIMGIFKTPNVQDFAPKNPLPLTVVCDNIREPGNLGTILRICAGVGCERIILTKGCVNFWDTKVLRSSAGAHFRLKIHSNLDWGEIETELGEGAIFFIADNKVVSDSEGGADLGAILEQVPLLPYFGVDFRASKRLVLVVGGETHGVSKESYELALKTSGARLNIPLSNGVDSLNVGAALGIVAFEIKKQLNK